MKKRIYLIGCMGNKKDLGFSQFDEVKSRLTKENPEWVIVSPADLDRSRGVVPDQFHDLPKDKKQEFLHATILLDLNLVNGCDAVYHMNGWRDSLGFCFVEHWYARRMNKELLFESGEDLYQMKKHEFRGEPKMDSLR